MVLKEKNKLARLHRTHYDLSLGHLQAFKNIYTVHSVSRQAANFHSLASLEEIDPIFESRKISKQCLLQIIQKVGKSTQILGGSGS